MLTKNEQILALIIFIITVYFTWKINKLEKKSIENFAITDADTIEAINTAVKKIYLTDVEAIRLLSNFAIQLSQGGTTIPGNVNFTGQVAVNGENLLLGTTNKWNIYTPANGGTSMFIAPVKTDGTSNWDKQIQYDGANRILTLGGVTANGNVSVTGDVSATGNVTTTGNVTATGTINGATINSLGNINATTGTGIITCKEIKSNISPFNSDGTVGQYLLGAFIVVRPTKNDAGYRISIYSSTPNYWNNTLKNGTNIYYIVMPGYRLDLYTGFDYTGTLIISINNQGGKTPLKSADYTSSLSCQLYYGPGPSGTVAREIPAIF
jgi:hypothetical protein